jgi:hypothetical protein
MTAAFASRRTATMHTRRHHPVRALSLHAHHPGLFVD